MPLPSATPSQIRSALLLREEIALLDQARGRLRHRPSAVRRHTAAIESTSRQRSGRRTGCADRAGRHVARASRRLRLGRLVEALGCTSIRHEGGLEGWRQAGYKIFEDVIYAKAFGKPVVEHRRHTPSLAADEVAGSSRRKPY